MCTRGDSAVIFGENRLIGIVTEQPSESEETQVPEMDAEEESQRRILDIEERGAAGPTTMSAAEEIVFDKELGREIVQGELLVTLREGLPDERIQGILDELSVDGKVVGGIPALSLIKLKVPPDALHEIQKKLSQHPDVSVASYNAMNYPYRGGGRGQRPGMGGKTEEETDGEQETPESQDKSEEEDSSLVFHNGIEIVKGQLLIRMKKEVPRERLTDVMKELAIEGTVISHHAYNSILLQVPHERIDEIMEKLNRHPDIESAAFNFVMRLPTDPRESGSGSDSDKPPERDEPKDPEGEQESKEEKEKPRSLIAEILAFLVQLVSQLRFGTGFDVTKYAENRSLRRQLRVIEGRMEAIDAQLARKDLSPQDRQALMRQNEMLEQEYQKVEKQLREQEKQRRRDTKPAEQEEGDEESGERAAGEGADRRQRRPEVVPRSEAQRALMEYVERIEQGEEVNLEEFRALFLRVVAESSPEERTRGLHEIAQGLNGLLMEMGEHFDEYYSSLPQGVREKFTASPEEAKEEVISSFKEAWRDLIAMVNSVYEDAGEDMGLTMDGNGIVSVRRRGSARDSERPGPANVPSGERRQHAGPEGGSPGRSVEQHVTVNVDTEHSQEPQEPAAQAQEAPEYRLEDLDTNALRSYLQSIGYLGDFAVQGDELVFTGVRGGKEIERVRAFLKGFPEGKGISHRVVETMSGASRTYEARVKLTSDALKHICSLSPSAESGRNSLQRPSGDYVEYIPATEFHSNGLVPVTIPAVIMERIGMGAQQRVLLIKQVSKGKFEVPRYLGDVRELPSFSPERWSREPSADQIIAERLGLEIRNMSGGVAIIIPEKWVWSSAEGSYNDGPPMVVNGAKVVGTDLRNSPYYFG